MRITHPFHPGARHERISLVGLSPAEKWGNETTRWVLDEVHETQKIVLPRRSHRGEDLLEARSRASRTAFSSSVDHMRPQPLPPISVLKPAQAPVENDWSRSTVDDNTMDYEDLALLMAQDL